MASMYNKFLAWLSTMVDRGNVLALAGEQAWDAAVAALTMFGERLPH